MSGKDKAITGTFYQFLAVSSSFIVGSAFYIYLSKYYSTTYVGYVAIFIAIAGIFNTVFSLGLSQASQHFISFYMARQQYEKIRSFLRKGIFYALLMSILAMLSVLALAPYLSVMFLHTPADVTTVRILGMYVFFLLLSSILSGMILGLQRFRAGGKIGMVTALLAYVLAGLLLFRFGSQIWIIIGWSIGYAFGTVASIAVIRIETRKFNCSNEFLDFRPVIKYSSPILFSSIVGLSAVYLDRFVVAYFISISTLGVYNFALLITSTLGLFVSPLYNVMMPKLSELFSLNDSTGIKNGIKISSNFISFFYVPAALGAAALAPRILLLLTGSEYLPATLPLMILLIISAIFITQGVFVQSISAVRRTPVFVVSATATLISNVSLSFVLIPVYGIVGAAIANSSVTVVSFFILFGVMRAQGLSNFDVTTITKIWCASVAMAVAVFIFSSIIPTAHVMLFPLILLGAMLYFGLVKIVKVVRPEDKAWLLAAVKGSSGFFHRLLSLLL